MSHIVDINREVSLIFYNQPSHIIDIVHKDSQSILSLYNRMSHIFYTKGEPMNRVKDYHLLLGISQLDLAKAIGVSRQTINMIENNKYNPSLDLCINLAKALQTDLNSLFWNEQKRKYHEKEYTQKPYLYSYFYPALCPLSALGQQRSRNLAHHQPSKILATSADCWDHLLLRLCLHLTIVRSKIRSCL